MLEAREGIDTQRHGGGEDDNDDRPHKPLHAVTAGCPARSIEPAIPVVALGGQKQSRGQGVAVAVGVGVCVCTLLLHVLSAGHAAAVEGDPPPAGGAEEFREGE